LDTNYEKAWEKINQANRIAILPHKDADGDAIGSAFGLKVALKNMGKKACVWMEDGDTHKLLSVIRGLCGCDGAPEDGAPYACHPTKMRFDLAISVDSADYGRLGKRAEFFQSMGEATIAFDHHQSFTHYAGVNILEEPTGACAEIVYKFLVDCGIEITADIAHNLYLGISSDTGGFRQTNTTPQSMDIGAELIRRGANHGEINTTLFLNTSLKYIKVLGEVLSCLRTFHNDEIAILCASQKVLEQHGAQDEETEGLVNYARNIIGVKIGIFLRERLSDDGTPYIKISMRSNSDKYSVAELCKRFDGGGHLRAAGGEVAYGDMERAVEEVAEVTAEFIEQIDKGLMNNE